MRKIIKTSLITLEGLLIQAFFTNPILAQTATPTATPTSTSSALPEAGNFSFTILMILVGLSLVVLGIFFSFALAKKEA